MFTFVCHVSVSNVGNSCTKLSFRLERAVFQSEQSVEPYKAASLAVLIQITMCNYTYKVIQSIAYLQLLRKSPLITHECLIIS